MSEPNRTKEGFLIPRPFAFHQTLGCHGHESRGNDANSYVSLAVTLKAFESTRSLPYEPPKIVDRNEWVGCALVFPLRTDETLAAQTHGT